MSLGQNLLLLAALVIAAAFFSLAEISLAASRRLRLRRMAEDGDARADKVMRVQQQPGHYFTVIQIGVNALAILGGIVGEGLFSPYAARLLEQWLAPELSASLGFLVSFILVTSLFIVLTDLIPKQAGMAEPERFAVRVIGLMLFLAKLFKPLVWIYSHIADGLMRLLGLPMRRDDRVTSDDILALTEAGARSGLLARGEQQIIENIFELDTRTVPSAMTQRDRIAYFHLDDPDDIIRARISEEPYSTYPVCQGDIDHVVGYVEARDLFQRVLNNQPISLADGQLIHKALVVPDRLTLAEVLEQFRQVGEDFAIIVNEYSLVVGVVTLNDVMSTVMGDLVSPWDEDQIIQRDESSWLIDGATPIQDVRRALSLEELLHDDEYETLAGFLMDMLRRVPRRTDTVRLGDYKFEVMDVDTYRVDQVLVTRITPPALPVVVAPAKE
ncbi:hemolysin family protein [Allopusillimonas ginsengisoli]|uniref:hemolysin family protein n=1 Tax=Allopusillimonas ginsengisoli TaxID=453575 RepID=UPI001020272B|nr:hemolysin family protein [Allopusillimonas ginsengisoli]TEA72269.1 HlyC/CorC family transporter [Allopusillimonas ginsengisoli]